MFTRLMMIVLALPLVATGVGLVMLGVFAPIGAPMLIVGVSLISAATNPSPGR
jgi:hypothetical protein